MLGKLSGGIVGFVTGTSIVLTRAFFPLGPLNINYDRRGVFFFE